MLCREACIVKEYSDRIEVATLYCRNWSCDICAPRRQAEVAEQIRQGKPTTFLTLTIPSGQGRTPTTACEALKGAFVELIRQIRRREPDADIQYFAVVERTKRGWPHLHVAARMPFVPQGWVSDVMASLIGAPVVDIRRVRSQKGVAKYLSKYLTKGLEKFGSLKRYWKSQGWLIPNGDEPPKEKPLWIDIKDTTAKRCATLMTMAPTWREIVEQDGEDYYVLEFRKYPP